MLVCWVLSALMGVKGKVLQLSLADERNVETSCLGQVETKAPKATGDIPRVVTMAEVRGLSP